MFNVQVDENMFYTGNYAIVGSVHNGVDVNDLPPDENALCYKLVETSDGVTKWEFSQEKYDELEAVKVAAEEQQKVENEYRESISNETLKAENQALTEQIDMLTACLLEMSEMVYA